jgi:hypothetical protein
MDQWEDVHFIWEFLVGVARGGDQLIQGNCTRHITWQESNPANSQTGRNALVAARQTLHCGHLKMKMKMKMSGVGSRR